jgi:hypothetical protein
MELDTSDWACELHLFLSVDIAGSTKYKNSRPDSDEHPQYWKALFDLLYQEIEAGFRKEIRDKEKNDKLFSRPIVWKLLGDEIIFDSVIKTENETVRFVSAFIKALRQLDLQIMKSYPVRLKGTGWTAGVPIRNAVFK